MKVSALLSSEWKGILISMPVTIPTSENYHIKQRKPSIKKKIICSFFNSPEVLKIKQNSTLQWKDFLHEWRALFFRDYICTINHSSKSERAEQSSLALKSTFKFFSQSVQKSFPLITGLMLLHNCEFPNLGLPFFSRMEGILGKHYRRW